MYYTRYKFYLYLKLYIHIHLSWKKRILGEYFQTVYQLLMRYSRIKRRKSINLICEATFK